MPEEQGSRYKIERSENPEFLFLPTVSACDAFGIARTNSFRAFNDNSPGIGFLKGNQFRSNTFAKGLDETNKKNETNGPKLEMGKDKFNTALQKNILDEVCLEFIGNAPTTVDMKEGPNNTTQSKIKNNTVREPFYTIYVAPSDTDWLSFSHSHTYESGGGILQQVLQTLAEGMTAIDETVNAGSNVMIESVIKGGRNFKANQITKAEFSSLYKETEALDFEIPFTLFTPGGGLEDFVRDIFYPIMTINYLTYPKRIPNEDSNSQSASNPNAANDQKGSVIKGTNQGGEGGISTAITAELNLLVPGLRMAVLEPPSYIRAIHSSGLFRFPTCNITGFSYTYKGPWVKMTKDQLKMPEYSAFSSDSTFMKRGFPCIAECKISLRTSDPLYADDWADIFNKSDVVVESSGQATNESVNIVRDDQDPSNLQGGVESKFGSGVRFASQIGANIGFRGNL